MNGYTAFCQHCNFNYENDLTPIVKRIFPLTGSAETSIKIDMTGVDTINPNNNEVLIGDSLCEFIKITETNRLIVRVKGAPIGVHNVTVRVIGKGNAKISSEVYFVVQPSIVYIYPKTGSLGGKFSYII